MADSIAKALATPRELKINGSVYRIVPWNISDLASYEHYFKDNIRESLLGTKNIDKRVAIQEIIASEREGISIDKIMDSVDGIRFACWSISQT